MGFFEERRIKKEIDEYRHMLISFSLRDDKIKKECDECDQKIEKLRAELYDNFKFDCTLREFDRDSIEVRKHWVGICSEGIEYADLRLFPTTRDTLKYIEEIHDFKVSVLLPIRQELLPKILGCKQKIEQLEKR